MDSKHIKWGIGGGSTFSPNDIAGIEVWLDADVGVTITGSGVSLWEDQSINNIDATQGTDGNRPTNPSNIMNGHKVIRFDGADNFLNLPAGFYTALSSASTFTFFIVFSIDADLAISDLISSCFDEDPNRWGLDANEGVLRACAMDGGWSQVNFSNSDYVVATKTLAMVQWNITGPVSELEVNGGAKDGTVDHTQPSSLGSFIGALDGTSEFLDGDIAEIIGYSTILSSGDKADVINYLNTKYSIY